MSETNLSPSVPLDISTIVGSIANSPEYQRNHEEGYSTERALSRAALEMAGMDRQTTLEDVFELETKGASQEQALNGLVGMMPSFVHSLEGIRQYHTEKTLSYKEFRAMKARATRFNHSVKSLIEHNPSLTVDNIVDVVTTLYGVLNRDRWGDDRQGFETEAGQFKQSFEGRLRGMQQEVITLQIIDEINQIKPVINKNTGQTRPRITVNPHVSAEDDLRGVDMYVTLDGVTFPIDIKASDRTAENTRRKSTHPMAIITTGITAHELGSSLRASNWQARKVAPSLLEKLYAARAEFLAAQASASQSVAQAA